MKRKIIIIVMLVVLSMSTSLVTYASNSKAIDSDKIFAELKGISEERGLLAFETEDAVVDLTKSQEKSTAKKIKGSKSVMFLNFFNKIVSRSNPVNTSSVECKQPAFDSAYCLAKSSSTVMEDYIYAKVRCYNGNGSLADQE